MMHHAREKRRGASLVALRKERRKSKTRQNWSICDSPVQTARALAVASKLAASATFSLQFATNAASFYWLKN
jgi:hypothetical protein